STAGAGWTSTWRASRTSSRPSSGRAQRGLRREHRHVRCLFVGLAVQARGKAGNRVVAPLDETPVFTLTGGIFKDARHPNAAKLYLTCFLAKEQQVRVGSFSSRVDVPPPEAFQPPPSSHTP